MDLLDDTSCTNGIDLASLDNFESHISVVVIVGQATECGTDTSVNVCVVLEKTLVEGVVEVGSCIELLNQIVLCVCKVVAY
jgi:hypothetical protein